MGNLMRIEEAGVPMGVYDLGDFDNALAYGKHSSASRASSEMLKLHLEEVRLRRFYSYTDRWPT